MGMNTSKMFRIGVRTFATTARRAVETAAHMEAANSYGIGVSKAQGIVKGLTGAIGNTPLIRLNHISDATCCEVLGKAEFMNPGGSGQWLKAQLETLALDSRTSADPRVI